MEDTKVKITREVEATSDGQIQRKQTDYRSIPSTSTSPVNHTLLLRTVDFLSSGTAIGTEVMKKLKKDIARKIEAKDDDDEDSQHDEIILTPTQSGTIPPSQYKTKHGTLDFGSLVANSAVDVFERSTLSNADDSAIRDTLTPLLENVASKDDVSEIRALLAGQKSQEAPVESIKTLTDQVAEIRGLLGRFRLESEENMGGLRQDLHEIRTIVSAILSYNPAQVAGVENQVATFRSDLSDWIEQARRVLPKSYLELEEGIDAMVKERSTEQIDLLREILISLRSLGMNDTAARGTIVAPRTGSTITPARGTLRADPRTSRQ